MHFEHEIDFLRNLDLRAQVFGKDLEEELDFLRNLGLRAQVFGTDLKKLFDGCTDCKIFLVVMRPGGDELYHPETLSEPDMSKLRNWIRCGDPTGLRPEWKSVKTSVFNTKVYLAGQDLGIDCTSVMDDMFAEEGGKKYTYTYCALDKGVKKIVHPQEYLLLGEHYGKLWRAAEDFSDLCVLNRKFLLGEIPQTIYHGGPIDDETIPLVEGLLKLHDFRLLTDGSQPYEHGRAYELGNEWTEYQQRPYIAFIMPGENGQCLEFFERLKKRSEIVVQACELHPFRILPDSHEQVAVSRIRIAKTVEDLETTAWKDVTWALCESDISADEYYFGLDAIKRSSPLRFYVAASEWGVSLDLLGVIEEVAIECDLPRMSPTV